MSHPLTEFRLKRKLSRHELAAQVGISRQSIFRIENREQKPSLDLVQKLVDATGGELRADDFFTPRETAEAAE